MQHLGWGHCKLWQDRFHEIRCCITSECHLAWGRVRPSSFCLVSADVTETSLRNPVSGAVNLSQTWGCSPATAVGPPLQILCLLTTTGMKVHGCSAVWWSFLVSPTAASGGAGCLDPALPPSCVGTGAPFTPLCPLGSLCITWLSLLLSTLSICVCKHLLERAKTKKASTVNKNGPWLSSLLYRNSWLGKKITVFLWQHYWFAPSGRKMYCSVHLCWCYNWGVVNRAECEQSLCDMCDPLSLWGSKSFTISQHWWYQMAMGDAVSKVNTWWRWIKTLPAVGKGC